MAVTQVIKTLGNVLEGMKTIIDSWLSTNITNPSSPPLDRSLSLANAAAPADLVGDLKTNIDRIDDKAPVIVESVSGDMVSFDDGAEDMPLKKCLIQIEPVQDLHGLDNPYPPGGGKNKYSGPSTVSVNNQLFANIDIDPIPAGIYTISAIIGTAPVTGVSCRISFRKSDGTAIEAVSLPYTANTRTSVYFTLSDTCTKIYFYYAATTSGTGNQTFVDVQIEPGTAMSDYAPYANICPITGRTGGNVTVSPTDNPNDPDKTVYPVTWQTEAGTVYGGLLDVSTGVLTVTHIGIELDSSLVWQKSTSYPGGFYKTRSAFPVPAGDNKNILCSHAKTVLNINRYLYGTCYVDGSINIRIMDENASLQDWYDYLDAQQQNGTPVTLYYEATTPIVYNLTPIEIKTLFQNNSIWSDIGSVSVDYCADTKTYIDNKIAEIVNG